MKTITIVAVTTRKLNEHLDAIERTAECIPNKYFITKRLVDLRPHFYDDGLMLVNRFLLEDLHDAISTDCAITVHWDGYAVNPSMWTDEFLEYDYIGAPWPFWCILKKPSLGLRFAHVVGNGGFSLRSKKWMKVCKQIAYLHRDEPEDAWCCRTMVEYFLAAGCKIAPIELAMQFSYENHLLRFPDWNVRKSFGFHGIKAMKKLGLL